MSLTNADQREIEGSARGIAQSIGAALPKDVGFALLLFTFDHEPNEDGFLTWISNAQRADMIAALKELTARLDGRAVAPMKGGSPA